MKITILRLFCLFIVTLLGFSCNDDIKSTYLDYTDEEYEKLTQRLDLPSELYDYSPEFEEDFFNNHLEEGNIQSRRSSHKATLGRVLFYDKTLSINEVISCASCHQQSLAFADDVAFSEGFDGELTTRNSLPLGNTIGFETSYRGGGNDFGFGNQAQFSWDESNADISSQSKAAITSEIEMGLNMSELVNRLKKQEDYKILFEKAYGDQNILEHRVLEAIEEFVNSIVSNHSKFDAESMSADLNIFQDFSGYTSQENNGKTLYMNNCASCHSFDHQFTEVATANNGLDINYEDKGVGEHSSDPSKLGVFKVPFLRNIELTGPYMHDGRFATLDDVINHYSEGIQNHDNLHNNLRSGSGAIKMNFTDDQKASLKAYLLTLTDKEVIADVKFSDPFK
ncbi:MAG: cytochrome c peroxidase [Saprospiraceae bacterium]|jgi:cytochrome c peroxidase